MSLAALPSTPQLNTSTERIAEVFHVPALREAIRYDRGVGYFASTWLRMVAQGLLPFAANGGKARVIASPKLSKEDWAALGRGCDAKDDPVVMAALSETVHELAHNPDQTDTAAVLAWMIADGLLEFRIAVPTGELDGDFHDKFGQYHDDAGNIVAFMGSPNDSVRAFRNYESISCFYSWMDRREAERVAHEVQRFERIWENQDANVRTFPLPAAIRRNLVEFIEHEARPYTEPKRRSREPLDDPRWRHQKEALARFINAKHGILQMATGTGKTRTALAIINELVARDQIDSAVITMSGNDLLDQWRNELVKGVTMPLYRAYGDHRDQQAFLNDVLGSILLISRQNLAPVLARLPPTHLKRMLIVCDEVHGMGSPALVEALKGRISPFAYRLGLSATPEREYDGEGNVFIDQEIGPVIFEFGLQDAIERGILCEFDYVPLGYEFSDEDRAAVAQAIKRHHARTLAGEGRPIEDLYQELSRIKKLSLEKLPPFREYVRDNPKVLERCLIFVETQEYGLHVQERLMERGVDFHTYYGGNDPSELRKFARGELDCLVTCHRVSEGIDIRSVNSIILFSAARARLETVQRLGRCLRSDPDSPDKRAVVLDFVRTDDVDDDDASAEETSDQERAHWISELAKVRRAQ